MKKNDNPLWRFFASVKLALFTLFFLAATSIIGTLIPQKNPPQFYLENFGPGGARFIELLDVQDMYASWWFLALLLLFSINLIVCTFDRLPDVWRMVVLNNLDTTRDKLAKQPHRLEYLSDEAPETTATTASGLLAQSGWGPQQAGTLLFSQKCAWSRLGVYAVHLSILIIFAGALIGTFTGFKGSVMIPEGSSADSVFEQISGRPIPLGFEVRCNDFNLSYYADGATPKEFRSELTVRDPATGETKTEPIVVNDPLDFKGVTLYQSSYEPMQAFRVTLTQKNGGKETRFEIPFGEKIHWPDTNIDFGIINQQVASRMGDVVSVKFWFSDGKGDPEIFWLNNNASQTITRPSGAYDVAVSQMYSTGLQATKDPGVWVVYFGCALMLAGLYVAFFLSHRRVWIYIDQDAERCRVLVAGTSSKNKLGFEKEFAALTEQLDRCSTLHRA
ncbi:MAG: cytochrome c biogenesis protein ResB [Thermodesulfobacteriota bacterium]